MNSQPAGQFEDRRRARRRALQALYQWELNRSDVEEILAQFLEEQDFGNVDLMLFKSLVRGVIKDCEELDVALQTFVDRPTWQLDVMERAILRMGAFELQNSPEVPFAVILDECIDLAKRFGAEQGHSFINGVLDKAAADWRKQEFLNKPASSV